MEEVQPEEMSGKPKISTLVFMDLESTGLPSDVGKRNVHITEMCLVAVDRVSFETDRQLRVLNKISLCVRPRFPISPGAMMITGLYNDMIESQEEFDDSIPKLLEYFFRRLQKPICLLAHNGKRFDYPVLQAELNRLNYALGSDIVCADTLEAFRSIRLTQRQTIADAEEAAKNQNGAREPDVENQNGAREPNVETPCKNTSILEEDIESLLSEDLECFASIDEVDLDAVKSNGLTVTTPTKAETFETKEFLSKSDNEKTPQTSIITSTSETNIRHNVRKRKVLDPTYTPKAEYQRNSKRANFVKRNLFVDPPDPETPNSDIHKMTSLTLENIYKHFFHESPPTSHYAETDCISLSKVCQRIKGEFLEWVDENCEPFSSINALW